MLLISSLISLNGYGQSFKFTTSGITFKIDPYSVHSGNITIEPGVNDGTTTTIVKGTEYTIEANTEYTVTGDFTVLDVYNNKLTSLDVSGLKALKEIECTHNDFDVCALDDLFKSLPQRSDDDNARFKIAYGATLENGIYNKCRTYLANERKWEVRAFISNGSSFYEEEIQNSKPFGCPEGGDEEDIQSFTFTSSGTTFKIGTISVNSQAIKIDPKVKKADGTETDIIEIGVEYIIDADLKYTVSSLFSQLHLGSNKLTSLDVSELIDLEALYCMENELKSLDVSKLTKLEALSCYENYLKSLDVTGLSKLTYIDCSDNLFEVCDFDNLLKSLETRPVGEYASVTIADIKKDEGDSDYDVNDYNAYFTCRSGIAKEKGWYVYYYDKYTDEIEIENSEPYGCHEDDDDEIQSFTFKSSVTTFKISSYSKIEGNITIEPGVNKGATTTTTIVKDVEYTIEADKEYTVTGDFTELDVYNNKLTSLDVSGLANIETLDCSKNNLKMLDLTGLKALGNVSCFNNDFDVCALDYIFLSLPARPEDDKGQIRIASTLHASQNDSYKTCRTQLANDRNWIVTVFKRKGTTIFDEELKNTGPFGCDETSIPENLVSELDIKVFPNPVRDALQIESVEVIKQISVFDISGKLLIKEFVNDVNFSLPTADLNRGMYVLRIQTDKDIRNIKVIKE